MAYRSAQLSPSPELADTLQPGDHGTTFGGGPVAASAALAALDVIDDMELLAGARDLGAQLMEGLAAIDGVGDVRGRGLMVGITLAGGFDALEVRDSCLDEGLVLNCPGPGMLRFLPPLVIREADVDLALRIVAAAAHRLGL